MQLGRSEGIILWLSDNLVFTPQHPPVVYLQFPPPPSLPNVAIDAESTKSHISAPTGKSQLAFACLRKQTFVDEQLFRPHLSKMAPFVPFTPPSLQAFTPRKAGTYPHSMTKTMFTNTLNVILVQRNADGVHNLVQPNHIKQYLDPMWRNFPLWNQAVWFCEKGTTFTCRFSSILFV